MADAFHLSNLPSFRMAPQALFTQMGEKDRLFDSSASLSRDYMADMDGSNGYGRLGGAVQSAGESLRGLSWVTDYLVTPVSQLVFPTSATNFQSNSQSTYENIYRYTRNILGSNFHGQSGCLSQPNTSSDSCRIQLANRSLQSSILSHSISSLFGCAAALESEKPSTQRAKLFESLLKNKRVSTSENDETGSAAKTGSTFAPKELCDQKLLDLFTSMADILQFLTKSSDNKYLSDTCISEMKSVDQMLDALKKQLDHCENCSKESELCRQNLKKVRQLWFGSDLACVKRDENAEPECAVKNVNYSATKQEPEMRKEKTPKKQPKSDDNNTKSALIAMQDDRQRKFNSKNRKSKKRNKKKLENVKCEGAVLDDENDDENLALLFNGNDLTSVQHLPFRKKPTNPCMHSTSSDTHQIPKSEPTVITVLNHSLMIDDHPLVSPDLVKPFSPEEIKKHQKQEKENEEQAEVMGLAVQHANERWNRAMAEDNYFLETQFEFDPEYPASPSNIPSQSGQRHVHFSEEPPEIFSF